MAKSFLLSLAAAAMVLPYGAAQAETPAKPAPAKPYKKTCRYSKGTTGLIAGGVVGAVVGGKIIGGGIAGPLVGAAGGALAGRAIDRTITKNKRCH